MSPELTCFREPRTCTHRKSDMHTHCLCVHVFAQYVRVLTRPSTLACTNHSLHRPKDLANTHTHTSAHMALSAASCLSLAALSFCSSSLRVWTSRLSSLTSSLFMWLAELIRVTQCLIARTLPFRTASRSLSRITYSKRERGRRLTRQDAAMALWFASALHVFARACHEVVPAENQLGLDLLRPVLAGWQLDLY